MGFSRLWLIVFPFWNETVPQFPFSPLHIIWVCAAGETVVHFSSFPSPVLQIRLSHTQTWRCREHQRCWLLSPVHCEVGLSMFFYGRDQNSLQSKRQTLVDRSDIYSQCSAFSFVASFLCLNRVPGLPLVNKMWAEVICRYSTSIVTILLLNLNSPVQVVSRPIPVTSLKLRNRYIEWMRYRKFAFMLQITIIIAPNKQHLTVCQI